MTEHQHDWNIQRERLSAFLDNRLPDAERKALAAHLNECAECSAELVELRQVVTLLHAMPTPPLPRSFVLPAAARSASTPLRPASSVAGMARVAQWAGGVAAACGGLLVVGTLLSGMLSGSSLSHQSAAGSSLPSSAPAPTSPIQRGPRINAGTATPDPAPATPASVMHEPASAQNGHLPTSVGAGSDLAALERELGGAGLFVGGSVVFVTGSVIRRRAR